MATKTSESIGSVVVPQKTGSGIFLTPTESPLGYRLIIRRRYVTEEDWTAQTAYFPRPADSPLEEELAAWDAASELALEDFEASL